MLETKTISHRGALSQYICHQQSEFCDDTESEQEDDQEIDITEMTTKKLLMTVPPTMTLFK